MPPALKQLTPVLIVDQVEPCLGFWTERFGFALENKVPGPDGKLVFASVKKDGIEVMYQTRTSVAADLPDAAKDLHGHSTALFITVADLGEVEKALAGAPVLRRPAPPGRRKEPARPPDAALQHRGASGRGGAGAPRRSGAKAAPQDLLWQH